MKKNGFFLIICSLLLIPIGFFATSCGPNNNEEKIDVKCYRNDNEVDINNTFFQENTDISLKITANQENNPNATIFFDEINPTA
jgi:hypothetical protein